MFWGFIIILAIWIGDREGSCTRLDVDVKHAGSAFFIKPVLHGQEFFSLNKQQKPFIVTKGTGAGVFEAEYGPFHARKHITDSLLQSALGNENSLGNRLIIGGLDISAHLVSRTITQERPVLQVLFHASQYEEYKSGNSHRHSDISYHWDEHAHDFIAVNTSQHWCLRIYVKNEGEELAGSCVLGGVESVCIAEVPIPLSWWSDNTNILNVYYSVFNANSNKQCIGINGNDQGADPHDETDGYTIDSVIGKRRNVSPITLNHGLSTYQELKEDLHILIYIPQRSFHPGSKLRVPVKLESGSDLSNFEIRVKVKQGLQVVGVEATNPDRWHISQEDIQNERRGVVLARLTDDSLPPSNRIEEVFEWIFEVEESPRIREDDAGRVIFTVTYERRQGVSNVSAFPDDVINRKVVGKVLIQYDNIYAIVPVIKTEELVNTAMLTGRPQNLAMQIYAVTHSGEMSDITSQTTCHSGADGVLKVAQGCNWVYLDGSEMGGSPKVNMIAKFGRHTKFMFFRVWAPEFPLEIELSDDKLSLIKGWRVDMSDLPLSQRIARGARDFDDVSGSEDGPCTLRYQQSIVEVYARFCVTDGDSKSYLADSKAVISVTDLVIDSLRVADESVAIVRGNILQGIGPGRTEIQVMSQAHARSHPQRPVTRAARVVQVANDKVTTDHLVVEIITGMEVRIEPESELSGTLTAKIVTSSRFTRHNQEGILDLSLRFSDGTIMPLHFFPSVDYFLDMEVLDDHVLSFDRMLAQHTPQIIALNPGKEELLKLSLELGNMCRRKKSRAMVVSYVYVDVNFTEKMLNEDPNGVGDTFSKPTPPPPAKTQPNVATHKRQMGDSRKMSALEIGMYVLLGVFCVAIMVFVINCVVFVLRYKQKQVPPHKRESVSNANDWVWIGRETLQRNAIQTDCKQALMSDHDFTVNKHVAKFLLPHSNNSSNRSSACTTTGNGGSNRNSIVSTYKGSECSIRITPNPLPGAMDSNTVPRQKLHAPLQRPPMHTFHGPQKRSVATGRRSTGPLPGEHTALSDIPSASALSASSSDDPSTFSSLPSRCSRGRVPTPQQQARLAMVAQEMAQRGPLQEQQVLLAQAAAQIAEREEDVANGNLTDASVHWDYETMGMTYDELMEYFDNLKESTA